MRGTRSSKRTRDSPVDGFLSKGKRVKHEKENHGSEIKVNPEGKINDPRGARRRGGVLGSRLSPSPRKELVKEAPTSTESDLSDEDDVATIHAVSAFERVRQDNIKANKEFFSTLGIFEAKENLRLSTEKPKAKPSQRGIKREKPPPPPRRASMRLRRMDPTGSPLPEIPDPVQVENEHERPPDGRLEMNNYLYGTTEPESSDRLRQKIISVTDCKKFGPLKPDGDLDSFVKAMSNTRLTVDRVAKVVPDRIFSVAIHPTRDKVLVAGGGKWGRVGVWDVEDVKDDMNGVVTYCPHSRPVNHLTFPTWQQDRLYSCAYDGSLRCAHFEQGVFDEVYSVDRDYDILLRNFDFMTPDTLLVAQSDGCVVSVDQRTNGTEAESVYSLQQRSLRSVSVHPVNNNYFLTSCINGEASVWDVRNLKNGRKKYNPPVATLNHGKGVNSAYFSPLTGSRILTTSADNKLSIFDSSSLTWDISLQKAISHNNFTGRWLTSFRAVWHPAREDVFVVGSMDRPRRVEMIDIEGHIVTTLMNEEVLGSVCSLNALHPSGHILVGGNSSGRLHVFM